MRGFDPVRVGVVGLGGFGRLHALTLSGLAEARLVAVVARRQASLDALREELPDVPGWLDLGTAATESGAEAWIVATSTSAHVPLTSLLLRRGSSVLVEKPLASSVAEAESLAPLVAPDSSNLMMGHIVLFNSELRQLLREIRSRPSPSFISCVRHRPAWTRAMYPGEDPFHLTMVHDLYSVLALVERREPARFSAQAGCARDGGYDLALAQLGWPDGLVASFTASFLTPEGLPPDGYDRMEVFGSGWGARIDGNPRPLTLWDDRARAPLTLEISTDPARPSGMLAEELRCFCRVVRKQVPVPVGAAYGDALQVERWVDTLIHRVENGQGGTSC
jgi:predicted dehydrogenase